MLSSVLLIGKLGKVIDDVYRELYVTRFLNETQSMKDRAVDRFLLKYWSENKKAPMYKVRDDYLVAVKGRLITEEKYGVVVIVEAIDYLDDYVKRDK